MATQGIAPLSRAQGRLDPDRFARALGNAFTRYGFAVVGDHGLAPETVQAALRQAQAFFALPEAAKLAYVAQGGAGQRGYTALGREAAKGAETSDLKEFWHVGREPPPGHPVHDTMVANLWPAELPAFRPAVQALYDALERLGAELLGAVELHLGLAGGALARATKDGDSILRLLHYPPLPHGVTGERAGAHEDINAITLLLGAEEAGLEILDRDGRWLPVAPPPGALVVNIGDMLQRLTNHVLPSTTHRVVNPPPARRHVSRYSMPFFLHFRPDYLISTEPACVSAERPDRYPEPIVAGDYLRQRLREIRLA